MKGLQRGFRIQGPVTAISVMALAVGCVSTPDPVRGLRPTPALEMVTVEGFGELPQATEEVIASTTHGWALVRYTSYASPAPTRSSPVGPLLLLADPDGNLFRLADLDSFVILANGEWKPGETTADVAANNTDGELNKAVLDLLTGEVTISDDPISETELVVNPAETVGVRLDDGTGSVVYGVAESYRLVDMNSGDVTTRSWGDGLLCAAPVWSPDGEQLLTTCGSSTTEGLVGPVVTSVDHPVRVVVNPEDGAILDQLPLDAGDLWQGYAGGTTDAGAVGIGWVVPTPEELADTPQLYYCGATAQLVDQVTATTVPVSVSAAEGVLHVLGTTGDVAYIWSHSGCESDSTIGELVAYDASGGSVVTLIDQPEVSGDLDVLPAR